MMVAGLGKVLRIFPDFTGKQRLARFLLRDKIRNYRNFEITGQYGCKYWVPNLVDNIGFELFINGIFEKEIISFILAHLPYNGVFLDLGANIGAVTLPVCRQLPGAKVICVEASPYAIRYLRRNISENSVINCNVYEGVISEKSKLKIDFFSPEGQFGKGAVTNLFNAKRDVLDSITLDDIILSEKIKKVDLIKVDIEGYEYFAFKGGEKLLKSADAPPILFEFVDYAESSVAGIKAGYAQSLLIEFGYELFLLKDGRLNRIDEPITTGFAMIWAVKKKYS